MRFWGSSKLDEIGWCWMHIQAWIWWQGILLQSQFSLFLCILKPEAYAQKLDRSKALAQLHIMNWHPDTSNIFGSSGWGNYAIRNTVDRTAMQIDLFEKSFKNVNHDAGPKMGMVIRFETTLRKNVAISWKNNHIGARHSWQQNEAIFGRSPDKRCSKYMTKCETPQRGLQPGEGVARHAFVRRDQLNKLRHSLHWGHRRSRRWSGPENPKWLRMVGHAAVQRVQHFSQYQALELGLR